MELLIYVHNHGPNEGGRSCGIAVGNSPEVQRIIERSLSSSAEFRTDADADPVTELQIAVAKAFAQTGATAAGKLVTYRGARSRLELRLEPGFDDAHSVLEPLLQVARNFRVRDGVVVNADATAASFPDSRVVPISPP